MPAVTVAEDREDTSVSPRDRLELSDYVESKVREMMAKEGVVLDFSDTKLKGRIVTKTKIIKEVVGKDGRTEIVEDEELDEAMFGPDLANISRLSNSSSSREKQNGSVEARSVPIYQLGPPVVSSTFERGATTAGRMSFSSCSGKEERREERVEERHMEERRQDGRPATPGGGFRGVGG